MSPAKISGVPPTDTAKAHSGATRTFKCRTVAQGRLSQLNYIRDLAPQPVITGEADNLLGDAFAPNALEALLAALGSCLAVGIHADAVARGIAIRSLDLDLESNINTSPVWGADKLTPRPIGCENIRVVVHMAADAPFETLNALVRHALIWSPVANTLHNPVHLDVGLAQP